MTQEPFLNAAMGMGPAAGTGTAATGGATTGGVARTETGSNTEAQGGGEPNTAPLPNPWGSTQGKCLPPLALPILVGPLAFVTK